MSVFDLTALYTIDPRSISEFKDAAATGVRAESFIKGWHVVCSYTAQREGPWRFSARRIEANADERFPLEFLKALGCPRTNSVFPLEDRDGWKHWKWGW